MKTTAKDWDEVRLAFSTSIMIDTALSSLAQNLDGPDWPVGGADETPAKYIDLDCDELVGQLRRSGHGPELADQLAEILRETLAFDRPFGEMAAQSAAVSARENQLLRNLARLGIPEDFPIALAVLEPGTREFCQLEKLATLGEFAVFAQSMAQTVIVGGDFKKLLNALSHVDEAALAGLLPFRRGAKGLHLAEALAQAARCADAAARAARAADWFGGERAAIENDVAAGGALARHFVALGDAAAEKQAAQLLRPHLRAAGGRPAGAARKGKGFFGWLFRRS
jgi:hypothetical protein